MLRLVYLLGLIIYMMESVCLHYRIILVSPHLSGMSLVGTCMHTYLLELAQCLCIYEWILLILCLHAYLIAAHVIPLPCLILLHQYAIYIYHYCHDSWSYLCVFCIWIWLLTVTYALPVPLFGPVIYMLIYAWWLLSWLISLYVHIHAYLDDPLFSLAMCMHLATLYFCYIYLSVSISFIVLYQITCIFTSDSACSLLLILCIYMHTCVSCPHCLGPSRYDFISFMTNRICFICRAFITGFLTIASELPYSLKGRDR